MRRLPASIPLRSRNRRGLAKRTKLEAVGGRVEACPMPVASACGNVRKDNLLPGIGMVIIVAVIAAGAWFLLSDRTAGPAEPDISAGASGESVPGDVTSPEETLLQEAGTPPLFAPLATNDTLTARPELLRGDEDIDQTLGAIRSSSSQKRTKSAPGTQPKAGASRDSE